MSCLQLCADLAEGHQVLAFEYEVLHRVVPSVRAGAPRGAAGSASCVTDRFGPDLTEPIGNTSSAAPTEPPGNMAVMAATQDRRARTRAAPPLTPAKPRPPAAARDKLLEAAGRLFYLEGIRATGVEAVAQAAGVAKISLYRAFDTKDDLVVAYLLRRRAAYWQQWDDLVAQHDDPAGQLLAVIDHLGDRTTTPGYRGCPFMNCAIEFPDPATPQHALAAAVKAEIRQRLTSMCAPWQLAPRGLPTPSSCSSRAPTPHVTPAEAPTARRQRYPASPAPSSPRKKRMPGEQVAELARQFRN